MENDDIPKPPKSYREQVNMDNVNTSLSQKQDYYILNSLGGDIQSKKSGGVGNEANSTVDFNKIKERNHLVRQMVENEINSDNIELGDPTIATHLRKPQNNDENYLRQQNLQQQNLGIIFLLKKS